MNRREENMKNNEADDARKNEIYKNKILTVPNVLSAFRLLLVPALAWLYLVRKDYSATAWVLLLSGATDIADGFIARRFGMGSDLGKALDHPNCDACLPVDALRQPAVPLRSANREGNRHRLHGHCRNSPHGKGSCGGMARQADDFSFIHADDCTCCVL